MNSKIYIKPSPFEKNLHMEFIDLQKNKNSQPRITWIQNNPGSRQFYSGCKHLVIQILKIKMSDFHTNFSHNF